MTALPVTPAELASQAIARRMRGILAENQISASALARIIGMAQPNMSRRLRGATPFGIDELQAIADVLDGADLAWLMGLGDDTGPRRITLVEGLAEGVVRHQGLEPRTRWFTASRPLTRRHLSVVPDEVAA